MKLKLRNYEKVVDGCGDLEKRTEACASFRVTYYEVVANASQEAAGKINTAILNAMKSKGAKNPFDAEASAFLARYQQEKERSRAHPLTWFGRRTMDLLSNTPDLLSFAVQEDMYYAGEAPLSRRTYFNFRPQTGELLHLSEIVAPGKLSELTQLAEQRFRADNGLYPDDSLKRAGFNFPDNQFVLTENWGVTPKGLVFGFAPGVIPRPAIVESPNATQAPPAEEGDSEEADSGMSENGLTEISLPWSLVTPCLKPDAKVIPPPAPAKKKLK